MVVKKDFLGCSDPVLFYIRVRLFLFQPIGQKGLLVDCFSYSRSSQNNHRRSNIRRSIGASYLPTSSGRRVFLPIAPIDRSHFAPALDLDWGPERSGCAHRELGLFFLKILFHKKSARSQS